MTGKGAWPFSRESRKNLNDNDSLQMASLCSKSFWYLKCISGLSDVMRAATRLARIQRGSHSGQGFLGVQRSGQGPG